VPYFGLMESNDTENLGGATKEIIKICMESAEGIARDVTFITVMAMQKLDGVIRISQSLAYNEKKSPQTYSQKFCMVMRKKFHFEKYQNTEHQIS
jgi:hypothetical protein